MKDKFLLVFWVFINIIVFWTNVSIAYLDPSAMTYIIQVIAAIAIAVSTSIGILFYKLKRKFSKKNKNTNEKNEIDNKE